MTRWNGWLTACVLTACAGAAMAGGFPEAAPRPPAPVYNGSDIAAANATIKRLGFDMVTVGAPGNRSWIESERWYPNGWSVNHIDDRGRVDYEFRVMRTEVVQTQYVDFVRAFRPFWLSIANIPGHVETGSPADSDFTSIGISIFGGFEVNPEYNNSAVTVSWRSAARYCNWLHHGAPTDPAELSWETFSTGAYTFTDESFTHTKFGPVTRNAEARFWLPALDELIKAGYYDPDRYGEGEEGYWPYPNSSQNEPWAGPPGEGDWGGAEDDELWEELTPGRYPHTVSPWGLLDIVGTATEWTETPWGVYYDENGEIQFTDSQRTIIGHISIPAGLIDDWMGLSEIGGGHSFRVATIVPTPSGMVFCMIVGAFAARRRC